MGHVQDLWTRQGPNGRPVHTERYKSGKRWLARWSDPDGKRHSKAFTTKDAATKHVELVSAQQQTGTYVPPNAVVVADLWPRWEVARSGLARTTREGYAAAWRRYLEPRWADTRISEITKTAFLEWLPTLRTKAPAGQQGDPLSASWARKIAIVMRGLLDLAVDDKLLPANPLTRLGKALPQQLPSDRRYLSVAEVDALYTAMEPYDLEIRVLVMTGIRRGEMAGLRAGDLDASRGRLRIARDVDSAGDVDSTKNRRHRDVPVGGDLLARLKERAKGKGRDELLMPSPTGGPWTRDSWRPRWEASRAKAGLGELDAHELRHTAASFAIHSGANVKTLQRMLGHSSAAITLDVYGHLWDDELDALPTAIDKHMESERGKNLQISRDKQPTNSVDSHYA